MKKFFINMMMLHQVLGMGNTAATDNSELPPNPLGNNHAQLNLNEVSDDVDFVERRIADVQDCIQNVNTLENQASADRENVFQLTCMFNDIYRAFLRTVEQLEENIVIIQEQSPEEIVNDGVLGEIVTNLYRMEDTVSRLRRSVVSGQEGLDEFLAVHAQSADEHSIRQLHQTRDAFSEAAVRLSSIREIILCFGRDDIIRNNANRSTNTICRRVRDRLRDIAENLREIIRIIAGRYRDIE